jgi:hypothetical protein
MCFAMQPDLPYNDEVNPKPLGLICLLILISVYFIASLVQLPDLIPICFLVLDLPSYALICLMCDELELFLYS